MKIKYAIYRNEIGLRATEYADTKKAIKHYPYILEEYLPVIINRVGGYTSFDLEYENEQGFIEIIEIDEDKEPLTREQMYPKNSKNFEYGWISPDGDTYNTGYEEHRYSAEVICKELGIKAYNCEFKIEEMGWLKVTGNMAGGKLRKAVYSNTHYITRKQADTLKELGLDRIESVKFMISRSEKNW